MPGQEAGLCRWEKVQRIGEYQRYEGQTVEQWEEKVLVIVLRAVLDPALLQRQNLGRNLGQNQSP
jgi:hypothetical protein